MAIVFDKKLINKRDCLIVKSNILIQKTRFDLSLQEQKIILYLLTKIKPSDTAFKEYIFAVKDFCNVCGIESTNHTYLKRTIKNLSDKSFWVWVDDTKEVLFRWISNSVYNHGEGTIALKICEDMRPYLLELKHKFTKYSLYYTLPMKSQYSIRIYEILKSYEKLSSWEYDIDTLKNQLMAEKYVQWNDFKRKVIDIAVREINKFSDIEVSYTLKKTGKRFTKIIFTIETKKDIEKRLETWKRIEDALS